MAAITTAAIGVAGAGFQIYQGMQQKKDAENALNEFERQDLENVYENMPISTLGSDLMREESGRTASTQVEASRAAGIRGIMGAVPKIQAQNNLQNRQAQIDLDSQVQKRNYSIAGDNQRIQGMQEQRDNADLAGIGQQMQAGQQNTFDGLRGLGNAAISGANNMDLTQRPKNLTTPTLEGYNPMNQIRLSTANAIIDPRNFYPKD
jgi:hypothetical protein